MANTAVSFQIDTKVLQRFINDIPKNADDILNSTANAMVADMQVSMKAGDYRPYKRGKRVHYSSRPNTPPAPDVGNLRGSIKAGRVIFGSQWRINVSAEYAEYMEFGTAHIAPRPFVRPVIMLWRNSKFASHAKANQWTK